MSYSKELHYTNLAEFLFQKRVEVKTGKKIVKLRKEDV